MRWSSVLSNALALLGPRTRRSWAGATRAHIEHREIAVEELESFARHVRAEFARLGRVRWAEVNPHTRRVVVSFEENAYSLSHLERVVEEAERLAGLDGGGFGDDSREHPADREPEERLLFALAADVTGFLAGAALRLSLVPASSVAGNAAALLAVLKSSARLRHGLDERLGPRRAELVLNLALAAAQGAAQRPVSSLVDALHRRSLLREARARRRTWERREPELCAEAASHELGGARVAPRPMPLPRGPIEEYADRAWIVSLGGFGVSFITTRSFQRAIAALFGGLPKPARYGRDAFAAELGAALAERDVLVTDPSVLRRLDRIDCLVIDGELVPRAKFEIREVAPAGPIEPEQVREVVRRLFDPERPVASQRDGEWLLCPPPRAAAPLGDALEQAASDLAARGALVLALARAGVVVALAELEIVPQTGIDELVAAAHAAEMRVVIAGGDESTLNDSSADDVISGGAGIRGGIRRLQREGRAVCLVSRGSSVGLACADCGIGLAPRGAPPPWGAHLVCGDDLGDVRFILQACVQARQVAKQSVKIALGAATMGALVSAGGLLPLTTRRVIAVVNTATVMSMMNGLRATTALVNRALPAPRDRTPWHALDPRGVLARLGTSERGLTRAQAIERREPRPRVKPAVVELAEAVTDELFNPLAPLLAAGAGLSAVVGSFGDAAVVGGVMVFNAVVGGVQRFRTERAIRELTTASARRALVRRGGELVEVRSSDLVAGDLVMLTAGDVVPADCRLLDAEALEVDSSSLTGESMPTSKTPAASFEEEIADRASMLFEGTSIAAGRATAVVVATGDETEARRGTANAPPSPIESGVELRLRSLIDLTTPIALGAGAALVGAGLLRGRRLEDLIGAGVSLAVASVPEGLPLLATAAQLAAAKRLSARGALVRNARSIEALGRVDVLCVDKTGTVTQGNIELSSVSDGSEEAMARALTGPLRGVLAAGLRATPDSRLGERSADPIDLALRRAASTAGAREAHGAPGWARSIELPFEAGRGYHAVLSRTDAGVLLSVKGAPEVIVPQCARWGRSDGELALDEVTRRALADAASRLALRGLRVIAVAERLGGPGDGLAPERPSGLTFRGLLAFSDPVRPSAPEALARLRRAGVTTVMLTGDHPSTAQAIAAELALLGDGEVMTGAELALSSDEELDARIGRVTVFARATPAQKVRIVRALQRAGRVVAMVGDGANDAPAIRLANVGVAIGERSTSAARGAADVVLTDERIETLVDAIVEGRAMWASVRDAVSILVGGNLGEIGFTVAAALVDGKSPLNARQLLLVNLLTDVAPAMAIALRPPSRETLDSLAREGPDASLGAPLTRDIASRAAVTALGAGSAWLIGRFTGSAERARTIGLVALVGSQLGQTITSGGMSRSVILTGVASTALLAAIVQTPGVGRFFGCRPLGPAGWATAVGASIAATAAGAWAPRLAERALARLRLGAASGDTFPLVGPARAPE
ncbi:MAG: cation-transporting P-type ATPase [Sorangiineae bacterium]|nr:cation-transporting P-type ATPase [Polyangiaceae bacterium]MEB2322254.1 cation-transporting P-type ATPase [Sorangiineae bacterium]